MHLIAGRLVSFVSFVPFAYFLNQTVKLLPENFHGLLGLFSDLFGVVQLNLQEFLELFILLFGLLVFPELLEQNVNILASWGRSRLILIVFNETLEELQLLCENLVLAQSEAHV